MYGSNSFNIYWMKSQLTGYNEICSGKTVYDGDYTQIWSKSHKAFAEFETRYGYEGLANQLLPELESKNIPPSCDGTVTPPFESDDDQIGCPSGYPYLHSDGQCWDIPECSGKFPYGHTDGKCHTVVECNDPDFPLLEPQG